MWSSCNITALSWSKLMNYVSIKSPLNITPPWSPCQLPPPRKPHVLLSLLPWYPGHTSRTQVPALWCNQDCFPGDKEFLHFFFFFFFCPFYFIFFICSEFCHTLKWNSHGFTSVAHQAPLSMEFFRQEYQSGLPCPPPGDLPNPGIEPRAPALQEDSLPAYVVTVV